MFKQKKELIMVAIYRIYSLRFGSSGGERMSEQGVAGKYDGNIMYSCNIVEKQDLLKLFQERREKRIKENAGEGELNCDML
jgi:hypothetical protein